MDFVIWLFPTDRRTIFIQTGPWCSWLKLPHWKVGDCVFEPNYGPKVSKKQNVHPPPSIEKIPILWGAVTERQRARPQTASARVSNPVSGGQRHLIHLTILSKFSWPSLTYMCTNLA